MAIEKEHTVDDFKLEAEGVTNLIRQRKLKYENQLFEETRPALFSLAVIIGVLLICVTYYFLPSSKVKAVSVSGNNYLEKEYIIDVSQINYQSRVFFTLPSVASSRIEKDPMIEEANIRVLPDNIIQIVVKEKQPLGYRYEETGPVLLFANGNKTTLTRSYMSMLPRLPFIDGFLTDEQTLKLTNALAKIDLTMLEEMTEVRQYALDYDEEALMIQMREGGYFFASYYSLNKINLYHEIYVRLNSKDSCIFSDSGEKTLIAKACPWNEVPINHEYWLDANGNYLINRWGDRAVKHYYQDANGGFYLDANGNRIVIPINEYVEDVPDPNFYDNYMAGYYATGELIIPQEEPVEENVEDTTQITG